MAASQYLFRIVISLRQVAHARTLAQVGNFRVAAQVLHISQPALTRSIQALESSLGVPLFNRLAQGVEPTRFGEAFLPKAHLLLQVRDDLAREMKLLMELEQLELRISLGPYPFNLHAAEVMARLGSAHPGLQCRLRLDSWREVSAQVLRGESDLGVGDLSAAESDGRLQTEGVGQHTVQLYCRAGHPMLAQRNLTLAELSGMTLVGTRASVRLGSALGKLDGRAGTSDPTTGDFVPAWEVDEIHAAKRLVAASDAVGAALLTQIAPELESGALALLPCRTDWMRLNYGFILRRDRSVAPGALEFMAAFRAREDALKQREAALLVRYGRA